MRAVCSRNVDAVLKGLQVENMRRGYRTLISNSLTSKRGLKKVEGFQAIGKGFIRRVTGRRPLYTCGYFLFASARDKTIPLLILQYVIRGVVFLCGRPSPPPRDARRAHPTGRRFFSPSPVSSVRHLPRPCDCNFHFCCASHRQAGRHGGRFEVPSTLPRLSLRPRVLF